MDLSVIIVEYKDTEIIIPAINSIITWCNDSTEIIVTSNSCYSDEKQADIISKFSAANFIFNSENVGFGKACNQGILRSTGEYVLLFNPDCRMLDSSIKYAVKMMEENPYIGVIGPMIIDNAGEIQDSCRYFMTPLKLINRLLKRTFKSNTGSVLESVDTSKPQTIDWVSGACMLVRRSAIDSAGMFDPRYFMYVEDMDWCRTFWKHNWEVWHQPLWKVEHNAGRESTTRFSIMNRLMWIHIISLVKYYAKWLFMRPKEADQNNAS
ncbi:N-acetylglucosaminyl-diphospho-decaprenol L-rhamnosyltransferase [Geobacter sp. OR-1]|uniref:glycosyltransferase n=1 Tax=Geobacter sp. OR-1 TaxID=1266765 RepID=UPI0005424792|nr:glycosyltransferase family 2 protein [Geobacter sp. OR-1]GAM10716.1 N-acetylglucosaminyl-diphospho-decaprenol L-rhamnosyltransferase [Geobacter sp. OR-1]